MIVNTKSNLTLHNDTKNFVREEKKCTSMILLHLQENRHRRLYAQLGYASLFEYCVKELGYSHSETHRRLSSAKLLEEVPEAEKLLQDGKISLTTLAQIQTHINQNEKLSNHIITPEEKLNLVMEMQQLPTREVEKKLLGQRSQTPPAPPREIKKQITAELVRVNYNLKGSTLKLLEQAKSYLTKTKEISWDEVLEQLAEKFIEQRFVQRKIKTKTKTKNINKCKNVEAPKTSRYIPLPVRQQVWVRAHGMCEFTSYLTGRSCSSQHRLQYAHMLAYSKGGIPSTANIVLMCSEHHVMESAIEFPKFSLQNSALGLTAGKVGKVGKKGGKENGMEKIPSY